MEPQKEFNTFIRSFVPSEAQKKKLIEYWGLVMNEDLQKCQKGESYSEYTNFDAETFKAMI